MSYGKLLVVADDSAAGVHAVRVALQAAAAAAAELVVLRVVDDPWPFIEPGEVETKRALRDGAWKRVAADRVSDELSHLVASLGGSGVRATPVVRFGAQDAEVARCAELEHADLIILGRRAAGAPDWKTATHTLEGTLQRTRVPCLIVQPGQPSWRRIVVIGDTNAATGDVLERTFAFAWIFGSEVTVVEVEQAALADVNRTETVARKAFALWARLPRAGTFDVVVREGDGVSATLEAARELDASVLVAGYRRSDGIDPLGVLGGILDRASCTILAVPT